jgi:hypothetical protein
MGEPAFGLAGNGNKEAGFSFHCIAEYTGDLRAARQ